MPVDVQTRTAELRMLQAEYRIDRWQIANVTDKRDLMDRAKREIVERMLRELRGQLEQAITIEHGRIDHATDMEVWRGRVLVSVQSTQAPSRSSVVHYLDENGAPWMRGGGITIPDMSAAMAVITPPKPEPKFDPKDLDAVLPSDVGTW